MPNSHLRSAAELDKARQRLKQHNHQIVVSVCLGPGCLAKGSDRIYSFLQEAVRQEHLEEQGIVVKATGCHGLCQLGPICAILPEDSFYCAVAEKDLPEFVREVLIRRRPLERLLYRDPTSEKPARKTYEIPFYSRQRRSLTESIRHIGRDSVEDYLRLGGYAALAKALTSMTPDEIMKEVEISGLRGRGGGGFLTARKWRSCREAKGTPKYVICNGDEGDPGAFMDRCIMEGNPHAVIEGMIIGAYAIGSNNGFIYVRNEYPLAVERLTVAVGQARELGLLGDDILGSGFSFDIRINRGGGAFVCGESTALMASLEGKPGEPRAKYIHTVESGLHGKPTTLNNVETWANVPVIIAQGGRAFAAVGTEASKGTKVFSLVGNVRNTRLVEVPMGMTLREIVFDIGGGIADDKAFKAVQTGGPSGGCIPEKLLDTPVDFDELHNIGSMMGSGGLIVMDENTCMVNVARYFIEFLQNEACGKCTACREGMAQMLEILSRICAGKGKEGDVELLLDLCDLVEGAALCGLGNTACNPVRSTINYFRNEYDEHIRDRHCPGHECRGLFRYEIVAETCKGCRLCAKECPEDAITGERREPHTIDQEKCVRCGACFDVCPFSAIAKV